MADFLSADEPSRDLLISVWWMPSAGTDEALLDELEKKIKLRRKELGRGARVIAPYLPRLLCLCLAAFFVIHFVVGLAITLAGPAAVRAARHMRPRLAGKVSAGATPASFPAGAGSGRWTLCAQLPLAGARD